jgi:hypothetical protein
VLCCICMLRYSDSSLSNPILGGAGLVPYRTNLFFKRRNRPILGIDGPCGLQGTARHSSDEM